MTDGEPLFICSEDFTPPDPNRLARLQFPRDATPEEMNEAVQKLRREAGHGDDPPAKPPFKFTDATGTSEGLGLQIIGAGPPPKPAADEEDGERGAGG